MKKKMDILKKNKSRVGTILCNHIINNKREYLIVTILFFVGLIAGVIYINNINGEKINQINEFLNSLFNNIKNYENVELFELFKKSLTTNLMIVLLLWFGASTIVGIPIVYGTILVKGFSIGCTISSIIVCIGLGKGILIAISLLLLHNIIFIPTVFAISVSGLNLYKSIMKNKNRDNIKIEIFRHTIFCIIMLVLILLSSIIETYISTNISIILLKYIKI